VPATVSVHGILVVGATVRNAGKRAASRSSVRLYLSTDARVGGDRSLGVVAGRALGARLAFTVEGELALPGGLRAGRVWVVACADATRHVAESSERNNCRVSRAVRVVSTVAELAVRAIAAVPATLAARGSASLRVTVRNVGGSAGQAATLAVLLSVDGRRDARDQVIGTAAVPRLAAGARSAPAVALAVPVTLPSGSYRVLACIASRCRVGPQISIRDGAVTPSAIGTDRPTVFDASVAFLYSGPSATQHGLATGAVRAAQVAVVRGRVLARDGSPVAGVRVSVLGQPSLGYTFSRLDGMFDLAVNGGGSLNVDYRVAGFLPVQRPVTVPWHDFAAAGDVVLTALDTAVTHVSSGSASWQVHRSTVVTDADGARRATMLFPPGTLASLRMPDGSLHAVPAIAVRATEFTSGDSGPDAMPGALPGSSAYTYAIEYSADEAITAGAAGVTFDRPIVTYTDDFVGFPVGAEVPAGTYDAGMGRWAADPNGRVVEVVSVTGGVAALDVDGDGLADDASVLTPLGITTAELEQVGALFETGARLMRVATSHFSASDYNWPAGPPLLATAPRMAPQNDGPGASCRAGSIIICESQTLAERIPVTGTGLSLVYASDRVPGRIASRSLRILLRPATMPLVPNAIHVVVSVAGQTISEDFAPTAMETTFTWDGRDAYGRPLDGWVAATVQVGYEFYGQYYAAAGATKKAFGAFSGVTFTQGGPPPPPSGPRRGASGTIVIRRPIVIWREWHTHVGTWDLRGLGLGGWVLDPLELYDRDAGVLLNGDGTSERADRASYQGVALLAGWNGTGTAAGYLGDGSKAVGAKLSGPDGVAAGADGSIYVADPGNGRVRRIATDGTISSVYGGSACPAASCRPVDVAVGRDGSLYIADMNRLQVVRLSPAGVETLVAGTGTAGFGGDGGLAVDAQFTSPASVAIGPDDSVWIKDAAPLGGARVRRVAPDGLITTAIGGAPVPAANDGEGLPATQLQMNSTGDNALAVGPDGTVYVSDYSTNSFIRAIGPDGIQHRFAGIASGGQAGDGGPALAARLLNVHALAVGPDGSLYVGEAARLRRIAPDGTISTVAGDGVGGGYAGDGGPAGKARVNAVGGVAVAPDGGVVFSDVNNHRIRVVRSVLPSAATGETSLASRDGRVVYRFDAAGRHVSTVDGLTGTVLATLAYDAAGRLTSIADQHGQVTTIAHDSAGRPTRITAPGGQVTVLTTNAGGNLASITDPAGDTTGLAYASGGLLTVLQDPRAGLHTFGYDALGLLASDRDPAGGTQTLTRALLPDGAEVTITTALGRETRYRSELLADGTVLYRTTGPSGAVTETLEHPDGTVAIAYPDGRTEALDTGPDPRFGARVAVVTRDVLVEPGGPTSTTTAARAVTLASGGGVATLADTVVRNGATWSSTYTAATRTLATLSPAGRTSSATLDAHDDVVSEQVGTLTPTTATYDVRGLVTSITRGPLANALTYDAGGRLTSITDALGHTASYTSDAAGRAVSATTASGRRYSFTRDAAGNVTSIVPPGVTAATTLALDALDRVTSIDAPASTGLPPISDSYAYTLDREPGVATVRGDAIAPGYDPAGRDTGLTAPGLDVARTYGDLTDRVATATSTPGAGPAQTSTFTYAGDLTVGDSESGAVAATIATTFTSDLDVGSWSLDGAVSTIAHDADRLVTGDGPWTVAADGNGLQTSVVNGADATDAVSYEHDALGRLTARSVAVNGVVRQRLDVGYDAAGRVSTRTDTVGATAATRSYAHDADGRLTGVTGTGETSTYGYDALDTLVSGPAAVHPSVTSTVNALGELTQAVTTAGTTTYAYDASGRRVARTSHLGVTTGYVYANPVRPYELSASLEAGVTTIYRYDADGTLVAFERAGTRYLVAADQVGSPLAVYDTTTGAAVLTRSYDAYGQLHATVGSLGLPVGYAGGLDDPDTGLVRFGARDYDPATGRFLVADPLLYGGGQLNLFAYVADDPASRTDRSGMGERDVCKAGDAGINHELFALQSHLDYLSRHDNPNDEKARSERNSLLRRMQDLTHYLSPSALNDGKPVGDPAVASSGAATRG
jgi:RHS repeat-associated protein